MLVILTSVSFSTATQLNKTLSINDDEMAEYPSNQDAFDGWYFISIKGKCEGWSIGSIWHFFSIWATRQPLSLFDVTEDTEIRINGELYPLDKISDVRIKGFVGTSFFPFRWVRYEKQGINPPHDIMVFGFCKDVEIV